MNTGLNAVQEKKPQRKKKKICPSGNVVKWVTRNCMETTSETETNPLEMCMEKQKKKCKRGGVVIDVEAHAP